MSDSPEYTKSPWHGPVEDSPWPDRLAARVVQPGDRPLLQGYDLQGDLARHYRFAETILLSLSGQAPSEEWGRAFEICLIFLAPISVAEAPSHAAVLAKLCGAKSSGVLSVGAVALAEQSQYVVNHHQDLLLWLRDTEQSFPAEFRAKNQEDVAGVDRLRQSLSGLDLRVPIIDQEPSLVAACLGLMYACGLHSPEQWQAAWCCARLACVAAEAFAVRSGDFKSYPMDLPSFRYVEEEEDV